MQVTKSVTANFFCTRRQQENLYVRESRPLALLLSNSERLLL
jgi:hypothetical protein